MTVCNMCGCRSDPSGRSSELSVEDELQNVDTLQVRVVKGTRDTSAALICETTHIPTDLLYALSAASVYVSIGKRDNV